MTSHARALTAFSRRSRRSVGLRAALAVVAGLLAAGRAAAQSGGAAQAPAVTAGWQDGFVLQTTDGDYRLAVGMMGQVDGRFSLDNPNPIVNTFTIRKLRPTFSGRVAKYFDFKFMPDFGNGTAIVQDAYFDVRFSPKFRVRTGKDKVPVGYEWLQGDAYILLPERTLVTGLVPARDVGVQVQGDLSPRVFYAAGVFNGTPDGATTTTDVDVNDGKDLAGRVVIQPFRSARPSNRVLNGFGFQIGGSTGHETGALPSFKTSVGQTYFSYAAGVAARGLRTRVSPAVFYYYKAFGAFAEYAQSTQRMARGGSTIELGHHAWEATASVVLTGEPASDRGVRPKNSFDPAGGHWGALQFVARYARLKVDPMSFTAALAAIGASSDATAYAAAINWYPAAYVKYYLAFERTTFGSALTLDRAAENVVLFRAQLAF
jgi:phosphate-selective porin OprO/OprP